jgi:hypothetical protein
MNPVPNELFFVVFFLGGKKKLQLTVIMANHQVVELFLHKFPHKTKWLSGLNV